MKDPAFIRNQQKSQAAHINEHLDAFLSHQGLTNVDGVLRDDKGEENQFAPDRIVGEYMRMYYTPAVPDEVYINLCNDLGIELKMECLIDPEVLA